MWEKLYGGRWSAIGIIDASHLYPYGYGAF